MEACDILEELRRLYFDRDGVGYLDLERHVTEADVQRWSTEAGWSRSRVFEDIAKSIALGFSSSELSFTFCDRVVNDLFGPYSDTAQPKSELFWNVYLAFDEGEYYHGGNRDEDPVEIYTRPLIARIVAENI